MTHHHLKASPETCHWGFFDPNQPSVLTVKSGDTVTIDCVSGNPEFMPDAAKFRIPPELTEIHARSEHGHGPHILTGPVKVEGAKPGQVLEVRIHDVKLRTDWGHNIIRPLAGALPDDFDEPRNVIIPLDETRMVGTMPWGLELKLKPFFGVMGVAPPAGWGRITSVVPRAHGGNLDNKELGAGATLYLPVFREGALFSVGDGHGVQGDGEVCVTAIETSLQGTFEFILRDDMQLAYPRAETPTHYLTMGMDPDLDQCMVMALRDMLNLLNEKANLSREDAYMLCSLAADLRVTQAVNGSRGIHVMIEKSVVHPTRLAA
ncbi:MAG TPA: acetamidase/formamidase family protein [Xanthobacteraceae bacterium]|nr:acetamidase/formamidase family protein [Xanthobacteraceae bacterium]